ncbi:hypothetical protein NEPAR05_0908 [Nematocida parisii]|nr:hypothetical protein NEPAR07_0185 [Nematocida parisii]KAI5156925.1 hypothetical protein NEPAR05_0908 [Nematocida parisii]
MYSAVLSITPAEDDSTSSNTTENEESSVYVQSYSGNILITDKITFISADNKFSTELNTHSIEYIAHSESILITHCSINYSITSPHKNIIITEINQLISQHLNTTEIEEIECVYDKGIDIELITQWLINKNFIEKIKNKIKYKEIIEYNTHSVISNNNSTNSNKLYNNNSTEYNSNSVISNNNDTVCNNSTEYNTHSAISNIHSECTITEIESVKSILSIIFKIDDISIISHIINNICILSYIYNIPYYNTNKIKWLKKYFYNTSITINNILYNNYNNNINIYNINIIEEIEDKEIILNIINNIDINIINSIIKGSSISNRSNSNSNTDHIGNSTNNNNNDSICKYGTNNNNNDSICTYGTNNNNNTDTAVYTNSTNNTDTAVYTYSTYTNSTPSTDTYSTPTYDTLPYIWLYYLLKYNLFNDYSIRVNINNIDNIYIYYILNIIVKDIKLIEIVSGYDKIFEKEGIKNISIINGHGQISTEYILDSMRIKLLSDLVNNMNIASRLYIITSGIIIGVINGLGSTSGVYKLNAWNILLGLLKSKNKSIIKYMITVGIINRIETELIKENRRISAYTPIIKKVDGIIKNKSYVI